MQEFRLEEDAPEGDINLSVTQFQPGDWVDVIGRSKGKGFQGVMKKHNFQGQGAAHGSKTHRRNGAIGNRSTPGRIWKNMGMPGHMGDERVTVQNLRVLQVREADKSNFDQRRGSGREWQLCGRSAGDQASGKDRAMQPSTESTTRPRRRRSRHNSSII